MSLHDIPGPIIGLIVWLAGAAVFLGGIIIQALRGG